MIDTQKRPRGRPPVPDDERLEQRSIRLTPAQWKKVDLHGIAWLRKLLDRAKPPRPTDGETGAPPAPDQAP